MTKEELYDKIGYYINRYHRGRFSKERLLGDFQHDLFLKLHTRLDSMTDGLIKRAAYYHPLDRRGSVYNRRTDGMRREVVMPEYYDPAGEVTVYEEVPYEDSGLYFVVFINGESRRFKSVEDISEFTGVGRTAIYNAINRGLVGRYTNRKLSHIKSIEKMLTNPFNGSKTIIKKSITEAQWEKRTDHEDFELEDYNEFYKIYLHKESKESWLIKLKEQKFNPYLQNES